jgi:putative transposase
MARFARVVAIGVPHHVTQRGNARRLIFESDADRLVYLQLLESNCELQGLSVLGFCLMSNHVHLIVVPRRADAMALALRHAHGRYASYLNARHGASGHVWQGRYYSCPLDRGHLWAALRYTERNPVRAGMVAAPDLHRWSSAALHCGREVGPIPLRVDVELWQASWNTFSWCEFLGQPDDDREVQPLRTSTHTGRPLGAPDFVQALEQTLHRSLVPQKGGRPRKRHAEPAQTAFSLLED